MRKLLILLQLIFLLSATMISHAQQHNRFVFTQLKYDGNWDPYPETWQDILAFLATTTSLDCEPRRRVITAGDNQLFSSPFLVILGNESFPELTSDERQRIRRFLTNGGMIFAENSSGIRSGDFDASFRREISKIFPEKKLSKLPSTHPIYRSFYLLRGVGGRRLTNNYIEGIDLAGRTILVYSQNDIIGAWAKDRFGNYLWDCSPGGEGQRFEAQKLSQNIIMHSVCGTYKSDAVHQPYIEQKLRR
ncbi:MAG: DUF4159 domain-containing protein [Elusimicrobiota bacterium]